MSLVSFPSWGLTLEDLVSRDGLVYEKFTNVPFTGEIDEGLFRGNFINGKREKTWFKYYENGQLNYKGDYKNGKQEGTWVDYSEHGQIKYKIDYKNGKKEGPSVFYRDDGQLRAKGDFRDNKKEGTWVFYKDDGTKRMSENKIGTLILDEGSGVYRDNVKVSN